jgi:hypothetical protein
MSKVMKKGLMEWASEVVKVLSVEYCLDSCECMSLIEKAWSTGVEKSVSVSVSVVSSVSGKSKRLIPLPYNRETIDLNGCHGLSYNHGLFTQCCNIKLEEETYCNSCKTETETSSSGKPLCGTIEDRADPEFKDSENRKPVHYLSVLRKLRVKPEAAIEEAGKKNIRIDSFHLQDLPKPVKQVKEKVVKEKPVKEKVIKEKPVKEVKEKPVKEKVVKEPKPVKEKVVKEPKPIKEKVVKEPKPVKEKVVKEKKESVGRPKSTKKAIETSAVEDLFASLVAEEMSSNGSESETEAEVEVVKEVEVEVVKEVEVEVVKEVEVQQQEKQKQKKSDKKADKKVELESEKKERASMQNEEKEQKLQQAAAAKEQKLKEAAALKEQKLEKEALEKEQKLKDAAAAKEQKLKEAAALKEKKAQELAAAKEQKLKEAAAKKQKDVVKPVVDAKEKVEEPVEVTKVTVKRITIAGVEYLKSSTNMLYNPKTKEEVGIYNSETGGIDALPEESDDEEEVEDDYDSEDE